jgi:hypothetical protein
LWVVQAHLVLEQLVVPLVGMVEPVERHQLLQVELHN